MIDKKQNRLDSHSLRHKNCFVLIYPDHSVQHRSEEGGEGGQEERGGYNFTIPTHQHCVTQLRVTKKGCQLWRENLGAIFFVLNLEKLVLSNQSVLGGGDCGTGGQGCLLSLRIYGD